MTALKHPVLLWGLPVAVLIIIFWLSLFCYSAIPVSGADAIRALLPDTRQRYQKRWCKTFVCREARSPF